MRSIVAGAVVLIGATVAAQQPKLDDVLMRLGQYIVTYETKLATVVAEETYRQTLDTQQVPAERRVPSRNGIDPYRPPDRQPRPLNPNHRTRVLRSDYALTRTASGAAWVGYRDTFEIDGTAVRDHDLRLQQLLNSGAFAQAERIAEQNARYNIGADVISRNVNVPTFALQLLHPVNRDRFTFKRRGEETVDGRRGWILEFSERARPTIVRTPTGNNQASRGTIVVDPDSGAVLRTELAWEHVTGTMTVTYGSVPGIDALVPVKMVERFSRGDAILAGEATYSNYRQFQTGGRVLPPEEVRGGGNGEGRR